MVKEEEYVELTEGRASFLVPSDYNKKGPGRKSGSVFYNRQMELNRDVCISLLRSEKRRLSILDAMAATGVRSARMVLEVEPAPEVVANDSNPAATALMQLNFSRPGLDGITVTRKKANAAMAEDSFDYIDIDPFGTPVWYLHQALMSVRSGGIIGVTATDSAMLCGSARGSERRYLSRSGRWPFMHELGARNLLAYIVRTGASFDRAVYPLLTYFADHYFRVYVRVRNGVGRAMGQLENLGYVTYDRRTGTRRIEREYSAIGAGPAWTGAIHDAATLSSMRVEDWYGSGRRMGRMLELWRDEALAPPLFYNTDELSQLFGFNLPSLRETIGALSPTHSACRTHFDPKGFKTDAGPSEIRELLVAAGWAKGIS